MDKTSSGAKTGLERFTVVPLTKETAEQLGHVAWIEEEDPSVAIKKMVTSLETGTFNCAVWVNAVAGENPAWRDEVLAWQKECGLDDTVKHSPYLQDRKVHLKQEAVLKSVDAQFAAASGKKPPLSLKEHMQRRVKEIYNAVADADSDMTTYIAYELRRQQTRQAEAAHTDGEEGHPKIWRFLEAVGQMSYLFSKEDMVRVTKNEGGIWVKTWGIPEQGEFTAYQAPQNSLVLFSSEAWGGKPILHDNPFLPAQEPPQKRTVMVYDMYKFRMWKP